MHVTVAEKRAARERLHTLINEESHGNPRASLVNAYRLKSEIRAKEAEFQASIPSHCVIRTLDPIIMAPEKKFEHCQGARISPGPPRSPPGLPTMVSNRYFLLQIKI